MSLPGKSATADNGRGYRQTRERGSRMADQEWVSAAEAAVIKGVTRRAVYQAIRTGKLAARRFEGRWLIRWADLDAWRVVGHRPRRPPG